MGQTSQADFAFVNKILNFNKWQLQNTGHKGRSLHALIKKIKIGMQFPLNLKHLILYLPTLTP